MKQFFKNNPWILQFLGILLIFFVIWLWMFFVVKPGEPQHGIHPQTMTIVMDFRTNNIVTNSHANIVIDVNTWEIINKRELRDLFKMFKVEYDRQMKTNQIKISTP